MKLSLSHNAIAIGVWALLLTTLACAGAKNDTLANNDLLPLIVTDTDGFRTRIPDPESQQSRRPAVILIMASFQTASLAANQALIEAYRSAPYPSKQAQSFDAYIVLFQPDAKTFLPLFQESNPDNLPSYYMHDGENLRVSEKLSPITLPTFVFSDCSRRVHRIEKRALDPIAIGKALSPRC